jgi:hypothetical protein
MPAILGTERPLPQPVRASLGLVAAGVRRARRVDVAELATLPLRGIAMAVRAYDALASRGKQQQVPPPAAEEEVTPDVSLGLPGEVADAVEQATPGATLAHDELPLKDYDHLTLGSLRARLPKLDAVALVQLRDYERAHANRLPVITMLENRIAKIGD